MTTTSAAAEATRLRQEADALDQSAEESFQRCDTDGFLSQWACNITARLKRAEATVAENGGMAIFPALYDLKGNRAKAKLIDGLYGRCWAFVGDDGRFTGQFISAFPKRESTMTKKGYQEGNEWAPAKAVIDGKGTGLSGAASAYVTVKRTDNGLGDDPRCRKEES